MGTKRLIVLAIVLVLVAATGLAVSQLGEDDTLASAPSSPDYQYVDPGLSYESTGIGFIVPKGMKSWVVKSVTDGDTLRLADGRRVRLIQIDAPEEATECYGRSATTALARLVVPGSRVFLVGDPSLDGRDGHGRLLRYVVDTDSVLVTYELVRQGAAVPYFFHGERGSLADRLLDAAKDARRERRGLWGACPGARLDPNRGALTGPA